LAFKMLIKAMAIKNNFLINSVLIYSVAKTTLIFE
jgi:hypothetical protein